MLKAKDIMTTDCITLSPDTDIATALRTLLDNRINGAPVVDDGLVVGVLCQSDLVAQQKKAPLPTFFTLLDGMIPLTSPEKMERELHKIAAMQVGDAMTPAPTFITPDTTIEDIATMMTNEKLYTLPVVEDGKLVGVVGKEDVLKTLIAK